MSVSADTLRQTPSTLYAGFVSTVNSAIPLGSLSPPAQAVVRAGVAIVEKAVGEAGEDIAKQILGEASKAIGKQTVDELSTVVSSIAQEVSAILPLVGSVVDFITGGIDAANANAAAHVSEQQSFAAQILARQLLGSGTDENGILGKVWPSDIFAFDPKTVPAASVPFYAFMPSSPLGIILAALTENSDAVRASNGFLPDSNIHHSSEALDSILRQAYWPLLAPDDLASELAIGIAPERRRAYKAARLAMGARASDHGLSPWTVYLDMLAADWGVHMTVSYALWLLTHYYESENAKAVVSSDPTSGNINAMSSSIPWSLSEIAPYVQQIDGLVQAWRVLRAKTPPAVMTHLAFTDPDLLVKIAAKQPFGVALLNTVSSLNGAVQASLLLGAYRRLQTAPRFASFLHNPALLGAFAK